MDYKIKLEQFEGPMDLLLHLIKIEDLDIVQINIEKIINQYLVFIESMKKMNLDVASEYLVMASELIEIKSSMLLPKTEVMDEEEDNREQLINKILEYKRYKEVTSDFKYLEEKRRLVYTKMPSNLGDYCDEDKINNYGDLNLDILLEAFNKFLERKNDEKPLYTKVTKKEYSVTKRNTEIKNILNIKKKIFFEDLFDIVTKEYVVVTFLSILELTKKGEIVMKQSQNFDKIILSLKGCE